MMALDNQNPWRNNEGRNWFNQNQMNNKDPNTMDIGATTTMTGTTLIGALTEEMRAAFVTAFSSLHSCSVLGKEIQ